MIPTLSGRPNTVLGIEGDQVRVSTRRSPQGTLVPIAWVQEGLDRLLAERSLDIAVEEVGYRSAFVGAVLAWLPGVASTARPPRVRLVAPLDDLFERAFAEVVLPRPPRYSAADPFAQLFTQDLETAVAALVSDTNSYLVRGSAGQGNWAETPWVAVFDRLVTESAQRGFYIVYLFRHDGSGVYLSLNQGTTAVIEEAGSQYQQVLESRAAAYRGLLPRAKLSGLLGGRIELGGGSTQLTPGYEAGNIAARFYAVGELPSNEDLAKHLREMLVLYAALIPAIDRVESSETQEEGAGTRTPMEARRLRWHQRAEGRNSRAAQLAKGVLGYVCQVCGFDFEWRYGDIGREYIEAHHLTPFSELDERPTALDPATDFAVVCSNCHRMLHRRVPPLSLDELRGFLNRG